MDGLNVDDIEIIAVIDIIQGVYSSTSIDIQHQPQRLLSSNSTLLINGNISGIIVDYRIRFILSDNTGMEDSNNAVLEEFNRGEVLSLFRFAFLFVMEFHCDLHGCIFSIKPRIRLCRTRTILHGIAWIGSLFRDTTKFTMSMWCYKRQFCYSCISIYNGLQDVCQRGEFGNCSDSSAAAFVAAYNDSYVIRTIQYNY